MKWLKKMHQKGLRYHPSNYTFKGIFVFHFSTCTLLEQPALRQDHALWSWCTSSTQFSSSQSACERCLQIPAALPQNIHFSVNTHSNKLPVWLFLPASAAEMQSERPKDTSAWQPRKCNEIPVTCSGRAATEKEQESLVKFFHHYLFSPYWHIENRCK